MRKAATSTGTSKTRMCRTIHRHEWDSLEEWVHTLDALSELDDAEIEDLVRVAANDAGYATDSDF